MSNFKIKYIKLNELTVDPSVQRAEGLSVARVHEIAEKFDLDAVGSLTVSERPDGTRIVLDGWHRSEGGKEAGRGEEKVPAIVFEGLTRQREHELFVLYNNTRKSSPLTNFVQRVGSEDPIAVEINEILRKHGWSVKRSSSNGTFQAVQAIENLYVRTENGAEIADKTIAILTRAWGFEQSAMHQTIVSGMGRFLARYGDDVDTQKLIKELKLTNPYSVRGHAAGARDSLGGSLAVNIARHLTALHNKNKSTHALPEWN